VSFAVTLAFATVPLAALAAVGGVDPAAPALGACSWAVAVAVKRALTPLLDKALHDITVRAAAHGLWSALCELGATAACFVYLLGELSIASTLAFGFGAATAEISMLLVLGIALSARLSKPGRRDAWRIGAQQSLVVRYQTAVERGVATALHVGSRALVYLAVSRGSAAFGVVALVGFASVDGVASFGRSVGWNWFAPATARCYYGFVASIGALEVLLYALSVS
jgi:hypothetical protein